MEINFEDAYYKEFKYDYSLAIDKDSLITQKADAKENIEKDNLIAYYEDGKLNLVVNNLESCEIIIRDHFNTLSQSCNLDYEDFDLKIKTDKLSYNTGDVITVDILPENEQVRLTYANETREATNTVQFTAEEYSNKITAEFSDKKAITIIHVSKKDNWNLTIKLVIFSLIVYFIYDISKKKLKRLK